MAEAWRETDTQEAAPAEQRPDLFPVPSPTAADMLSWAPAGSPMFVDYSPEVIKQIRDHVIVGFHRLAKRGIECGGILYGRREGRKVVVTQIREIVCEYKTGPSFVLSDRDKERLSRQLASPDEGLAGLSAVGFYLSHTRDDLYATDRDMAIYEGFFPNIWQVMLILRPARQGSLRAGFFVRGQLGEFRGDHSFEEFDVEGPETPAETAALIANARSANEPPPPPPAAAPRARAAAASASPGASVSDALFLPSNPISALPVEQMPVREPQQQARALERSWAGNAVAQQQQQPQRGSGSYMGSGLAPLGFQYSGVDSRPHYAPPAQVSKPRHWVWFAAWCGSLLAVALAAYWFINVRQAAPLLLRLAEQDGDLRIEWDRAAASVRNASAGALEIRDGNRSRQIRLSPEQLAVGSYLFPLGPGDVSVRMSVNGTWSASVEESASFVGEAQPASGNGRADSELRQHRDRLLQENRKLKNDTRKLEDRLEALEKKLNSVNSSAEAPRRSSRSK